MSRQSPARQVRKAQRRKQTRAQQQTNALALSKQLRADLIAHFQKLHAGKTDHTEYADLIHRLARSTDVELIQTFVHERQSGPRAAQDAPAGADTGPSATEAPGGAQGATTAAQEGSAALADAGFSPRSDVRTGAN